MVEVQVTVRGGVVLVCAAASKVVLLADPEALTNDLVASLWKDASPVPVATCRMCKGIGLSALVISFKLPATEEPTLAPSTI
jgi:hypothetical protein